MRLGRQIDTCQRVHLHDTSLNSLLFFEFEKPVGSLSRETGNQDRTESLILAQDERWRRA